MAVPRQAARERAMLMQLHERQDPHPQGGCWPGMADVLQLLCGDPVREGLGKLVKEG